MFFQLLGVFVLLFNIFSSVASEVATEVLDKAGEIGVAECELYLVPLSNPDYGRGLVAGKFIEEDVEIDRSVVLTIHADDCASTQLSNYVFGSHEYGIAIAQLGLDMLYNHNDIATVTRTWAPGDLHLFQEQELPHATHTEVLIRTRKNVSVGEEMFTDYGGSSWFLHRNLIMDPTVENELRSIDDLKKNGICVTDTGVMNSKLPFAGKGLFAKKSFSKGEIVTVSPVLLLGKDRVMDSAKTPSVLMNYCIASAHSNITLFPIALAALINHSPAHTANVEVDWYWWNKDGTNDETMNRKMQTSLLDLSLKGAAQLDLQYIATQDIKAGEEILYSYGEEWQDAWSEYSVEFTDWTNRAFKQLKAKQHAPAATGSIEVSSDGESSEPMPRFRFFIDGLDHLFLPFWRDT